ncbi:MAG: hypothetical protein GWN50_12145 [Candidatus Dadabacteria bacterium]|nr:hypothetical protein [Candidatus Dadabacteria bacterium]
MYKNGESLSLNSYQKIHLYGNTVGDLSTCRHRERVTGTAYTQEQARDELDKIKSTNYLKITFSKRAPSLPIAHTNQKVDEIYIGLDNRGFPHLLTVHKDKIQLYSKCSGSVAITNFSCDTVLSELLSFKRDENICKMLIKE